MEYIFSDDKSATALAEVKNNKILLISYFFPPYPDIGGRRWAKFAKYLTREGFEVHVISAQNPYNIQSIWEHDVHNNPNIIRYQYKSFYPTILEKNPSTIIEKINYRISLFLVRILSRGTPYDRSLFWNKRLLSKIETILKAENIKTAIITAAPFQTAHHALKLKITNPDLQLIVDFRDPWTWGQLNGMKNLSAKRLYYEQSCEAEVVKNCSAIIVPVEEMAEHLQSKYPFLKSIEVLPHGYDEDEVRILTKSKSDKIRIVLYGTLYSGLDETFKSLNKMITHNPNIELHVYSQTSRYSNYFSSDNRLSRVKYFSVLSSDEFFNRLVDYDFVLIVQPEFAKDFMSTKIFEVVYSKTPIILVSEYGKLSDFVEKNKIGYWLTPDKIEDLPEVIRAKLEHTATGSFPIENYSFQQLTKQLIRILNLN